jgi:hypothetical protein
MMSGLSRRRRVLSRFQDFSKVLGGRPRTKNDTIDIADRKIKHYYPAASQVTSSRLQTLATYAPG